MPERLLELHARWPQRYPVLFESAARSEKLGRYDLLFAFPQALITKEPGNPFLDRFDRTFQHEKSDFIPSSLPFTGGWVIFLGYEIASEVEPCLVLPPSPDPITARAMRVPAALIYEHETDQMHRVAEAGREDLLEQMNSDLESACPLVPSTPPLAAAVVEDPPDRFLAGVRRAKDYIRAGDVYQVNLSLGWSVECPAVTPAELYRALRVTNPAPFAASVVMGDWAVLSSSPERLFRVRDRSPKRDRAVACRARTRARRRGSPRIRRSARSM